MTISPSVVRLESTTSPFEAYWQPNAPRGFKSTRQLPTAILACKELYETVRKNTKAFSTQDIPGTTSFDPTVDTLFVEVFRNRHGDGTFSELEFIIDKENLRRVENLAVILPGSEKLFADFLCEYFPNARNVTFVLGEPRGKIETQSIKSEMCLIEPCNIWWTIQNYRNILNKTPNY